MFLSSQSTSDDALGLWQQGCTESPSLYLKIYYRPIYKIKIIQFLIWLSQSMSHNVVTDTSVEKWDYAKPWTTASKLPNWVSVSVSLHSVLERRDLCSSWYLDTGCQVWGSLCSYLHLISHSCWAAVCFYGFAVKVCLPEIQEGQQTLLWGKSLIGARPVKQQGCFLETCEHFV